MSSKKYRPMVTGVSDATRDREVQQEIDNFLRALSSYPDRFAHEPQLSFEQHLFRISAAGETRTDREALHRTR